MNANVSDSAMPRKRIFLNAENILRFLIKEDATLDKLLIYQDAGPEVVSTDTQIYQALGSIKDSDQFNLRKLVKLFEKIKLMPGKEKIMLTHERVKELRELALKTK